MSREASLSDLYRVASTLRPVMYKIAGSRPARRSNPVEWGGYSLDPHRIPPLIISEPGQPDFGVNLTHREIRATQALIKAGGHMINRYQVHESGKPSDVRVVVSYVRAKFGIYGDRIRTHHREGGYSLKAVDQSKAS